MAYIHATQIEDYAFIDSIKECEDESYTQSVLEVVSTIIDAYVGHDFYFHPNSSFDLCGDGGRRLELGCRVETVHSITINPDSMAIQVDVSTTKLVEGNRAIYSRIHRFYDGMYNILVTADAGYAVVPKEVLQVVVMLCNEYFLLLLDEEDLKRTAGPYNSEKIGNYSYSIKQRINEITGESIRTTGDSVCDQILNKFKRTLSIGVI